MQQLELVPTVENDILFVKTSGPVTVNGLKELGAIIKQNCDAKKLTKAIVDVSGMEGALAVGELYEATQLFIQEVGFNIRVAYIKPPAHWIPEDDKFSRDVAKNRGAVLEMFLTKEDAINWLG